MVRLATLLLFSLALFGYEYSRLLLKTQIELYPKILLLGLPKELQDGQIDFGVVYDPVDRSLAQQIASQLQREYTSLGAYPLKPHPIDAKRNLSQAIALDAIFVLKLQHQDLLQLAQLIQGRPIVSFVYDIADLSYGFLCGITLEDGVQIYLNKGVLLKSKIDFLDLFYQMVRFIE
ncbi:MAG: hypothetical protein C6I00_03680 [Nitratiruptor sp.]|nr:hypothetical protein [Nitratiruptor sp.]NPA83882.1 hypothetical protein [Campylobacterota bacterium]